MGRFNFSSLTLSTLAMFCLVTLSYSYIMELQLHESLHLNETYYVFRKNVPDASVYNLTAIKTLCYTGRWRGYNATDYAAPFTSSYASSSSSLHCVNYPWPHLSFRHYGNIDTDVDSISLYPMADMGGTEILVERTPFAAINVQIKSLGWTGKSDWTLFEGNNFDGASDCLKRPFLGSHDYIDDLEMDKKLNLTTIGSMFKGCETLNSTYIQSMREAWARQIHQ